MASWTNRKVVVKDYFISFEPLDQENGAHDIDLSQPIAKIAEGDPIYVVITGRPAGLINFIREHIGLSRRFEFVLSKTQAVVRLGSMSLQVQSVSKLKGLNTIAVGLRRPIAAALIVAFLSLILTFGALHGSDDAQSPSSLMIAATFGSFFAKSAFALMLAVAGWIWAAYLFFVSQRAFLAISEAGESVVQFVISPSLLEARNSNLPLEELNKIALIFRVLKDL